MPTYEYECQACHERLEAVQKFADAALTTCPKCGGELRKVFSAVGIVFKGSGFYKNDSRGTKSDSSTPAKTDAASPTIPATPASSTTTSATSAPSTASSSTSSD